MPARTFGLTHLALAVRDPERSLAFYRDAFGVREYFRSAADLDDAVEAVVRAGGKLLRRGEFAPGSPFAYVEDPDGYEIEIWFE